MLCEQDLIEKISECCLILIYGRKKRERFELDTTPGMSNLATKLGQIGGAPKCTETDL